MSRRAVRCGSHRSSTTPSISASIGHLLGLAGLEQFFNTGQTLGDIVAGDAAGVEGTHGQLRAGLADGLGGDDADRLAEVDQLARWQGSCRSTWRTRRCGRGSRGPYGHRRCECRGPRAAWHRPRASSDPWRSAARPFRGRTMSSTGKRPWMRVAEGLDDLSLLYDLGQAQMPCVVPQSCSRMMTSCETSTRRRVR